MGRPTYVGLRTYFMVAEPQPSAAARLPNENPGWRPCVS